MEYDFLIEVLTQDKPSKIIKDNEEQIFEIVPELVLCKGFNQNNIWHVYDVYEHILHVVDKVPNNLNLRLAALFHDIGKPYVYTETSDGVGHFKGHWDKSKEIFLKFACKYNIDEANKRVISNLITYHDFNISNATEMEIKKIVSLFSKEEIMMLFDLKRSDLLAQNPEFHYLLDEYEKQQEKLIKYL